MFICLVPCPRFPWFFLHRLSFVVLCHGCDTAIVSTSCGPILSTLALHVAAMQIDSQHQELESLHKGMRELEATLGRSEADKAAARALYEERVHAANARKKELERQLRSQAAAASEGAAAAPKIRELSQNLDKLQASKAAAVHELRACQVQCR